MTNSKHIQINYLLFFSKLTCTLIFLIGNGPALSLKAFRTLNKRFFWNGGTILQFTPQGIRPGIMSSRYN